MGKLKYVHGRVICKADLQSKNSHKFEDGTVIRLERQYNEFNRRITEPVNATVISAENIPPGSEILIGHNALHESNLIYDYLPEVAESSDVKYYSLPEEDCFAWRDANGVLNPMKNFVFALRVFKPYTGEIKGIEPSLLKDILYITTGELKGNLCHVLKASDYEIIFQGQNGREERKIRTRHFEDEMNEREEILGVSHQLNKLLKSGDLLIGLSPKDCKTLKNYNDA